MPTREEIEKLTAFLPRLYAKDFSPVKRWRGGERTEDGAATMPWPDYDQAVRDFFRTASAPCWTDGIHFEAGAAGMLEDEEYAGWVSDA